MGTWGAFLTELKVCAAVEDFACNTSTYLAQIVFALRVNSSKMCVHAFLKDRAQKAFSHSEIFVLLKAAGRY